MMTRLPLYLYVAVYAFTCLIGALFLIFSDTFTALVQLSTGVHSFWLSSEAVFFNLVLLIVAPALLVVGYELGVRTYPRRLAPVSRTRPEGAWALVILLWAVTAIVATASLARGGAFHNVAAWASYRQWVFARWQLFDTLNFLEFANIYNFLPVATALLLLRVFESPLPILRRALIAFGVAVPAVGVSAMLFQKKALMVFVLLVLLAALISRDLLERITTARASRILVLSGACAYVLYCILVAGPAVSRQALSMAAQPVWLDAGKQAPATQGRAEQTTVAAAPAPAPPQKSAAAAAAPAPTQKSETAPPTSEQVSAEPTVGPTGKPIPSENVRRRFVRLTTEALLPGRWIGIPPGSSVSLPHLSRGPALLSYVMLGPFVRTPMPALAYLAVYPKQIPFYGLDAGLDMFGIGQMPRDNIYVHRLLWPSIPGGSVMVPSQFSLFSQIGLGGALLLSVLTGYLIAALWLWLLDVSVGDVRAVACALMLMFVISVAGDSLRNSLLASYGVFWGWLLLAFWYVSLRVVPGMASVGSAQSARQL
jgi:hypothetical protein